MEQKRIGRVKAEYLAGVKWSDSTKEWLLEEADKSERYRKALQYVLAQVAEDGNATFDVVIDTLAGRPLNKLQEEDRRQGEGIIKVYLGTLDNGKGERE